jgi:hypothetical protein
MNENMLQITQLERQIEANKAQVRRGELVMKLSNISEFKELIMEEFMTAEVIRNVGLSADPALPKEQRADALAMAQAGGHLKRYLSAQVQMGRVAEREIPDLEANIQELLNEED